MEEEYEEDDEGEEEEEKSEEGGVEFDLEELTEQASEPQESFQEQFFDNDSTGDFAAPVLEQGEVPEANLEAVTADAPSVPATDNENPYLDPGAQGSSDSYDNDIRGGEKFEIGREFIADTSQINAPVLRPFAPSGGYGDDSGSIGDELAGFRENQRQYQEASEDDRSPPFARGRRKKDKIF